MHDALQALPKTAMLPARRLGSTALLVAVCLAACLAAGCETIEAVGAQIEKDSERSVEAVEPLNPPLPPRPIETIARLEARGADGDGMLQLLLAHGDETVRVRAATALGRLDAPEPGASRGASVRPTATAALCAALDDPAPVVRAAAAFALGMRADTAASEALLEHWMDRNVPVRARIVEAASRIDDAPLREQVLTALGDPALAVRLEAAVGPHRWATTDDDARDVDEALIRRARAIGAEPELVWRVLFTLQRRSCVVALPLYLAHAADEDPRARLFALKGIASIPTAELLAARAKTLATLRDRLTDPDWRVACEAATALGVHPDEGSIQSLAHVFNHESKHVRAQAAYALGHFDGSEEAGALLEVLVEVEWERSPTVAAAALEALGRLQGDDALPLLLGAFEADDARLRAGLARALAHVPSTEAAARLVRLSYDDVPRVAWFAVESMGAHIRTDRARLHELCTSVDNGLRLAAVSALREKPSPADLPFLRQAFETSSGDISEEVAFNALVTAAKIPGPLSVELVRRGLANDSAYVRRVARRLLRELAPDEFMPPPVATAMAEPAAAGDGRSVRSYRIAEIVTNRGTLTFELFRNEAPRHVENFVRLAESGAYDGLAFHRVVPDFVIQGGDHRGDGNGAQPWRGVPLRREFTARKYVRGSLGMPRNEDPDSGGSQIFVTHRETPHLDGRYTLFGQLTSGFDTLDAIVVGDVIQRVALR